jgi:hypothetical protein
VSTLSLELEIQGDECNYCHGCSTVKAWDDDMTDNAAALSLWNDYVKFMVSKGNIDQVMIVDTASGGLYASSAPDQYFLKQYTASIAQEDGTDKDELVNEADNLLAFINGNKPSHGLRINGLKQQVLRNFKDDTTDLVTIYGKVTMGGTCVMNAGRVIIIASFDETKGHTSNGCNEICRHMAIYLLKSAWPDQAGSTQAATSVQPTTVPQMKSPAPVATQPPAQAPSSSSGMDYRNVVKDIIDCGHVAATGVLSLDGRVLSKSDLFEVSCLVFQLRIDCIADL